MKRSGQKRRIEIRGLDFTEDEKHAIVALDRMRIMGTSLDGRLRIETTWPEYVRAFFFGKSDHGQFSLGDAQAAMCSLEKLCEPRPLWIFGKLSGPSTAKEILGHSFVTLTEEYSGLWLADLAAIYDRAVRPGILADAVDVRMTRDGSLSIELSVVFLGLMDLLETDLGLIPRRHFMNVDLSGFANDEPAIHPRLKRLMSEPSILDRKPQ